MSFWNLVGSFIHKQHKCDKEDCFVCKGGLYLCDICGGAEAALPTDCPGKALEEEELRQISTGLLDFVNGEWKQSFNPFLSVYDLARELIKANKIRDLNKFVEVSVGFVSAIELAITVLTATLVVKSRLEARPFLYEAVHKYLILWGKDADEILKGLE